MKWNISGLPQYKGRANPNVHHHKGQNNAHGGGIKKTTKKGEH